MSDASSVPDLPSSFSVDESSSSGRFRWWMVAVVVAVVALVAGGVIVVTNRHDAVPTAWPTWVDGRPAGLGTVNVPAPQVTVTAAPGLYAWSDFDGWHLWVVNGSGVTGMSGTITSDQPFTKAALAQAGAGTVTAKGNEISFQLPATPGLVGVDFLPGFFAQRVTFSLAGQSGHPSVAFTLGPHHAVTLVPAEVRKVPTPSSSTASS